MKCFPVNDEKFPLFFREKSNLFFLGKQLFDEKNANKLTQKILNDRFVLPTARGSTKPSIEFASLLQGLLVKEPSKR